ncbi:MAG: FtsL-like putative cell division protein [Bacteroidia bacterium]|nr:FtsL-like putative cell division protein [Bacteroidia bacterium]
MPKNKIKANPTPKLEEENKTIEEKVSNTTVVTEHPSSPSKGLLMRLLALVFGANFLERSDVQKQIYYFIFLIFIGILYITNGNMADKKIREINKLNKELKELRSEYIISKAELMFLNKQSEVAKRVEPLGLKETTQQPYLILNTDTTLKIY